MKLRVQPQPLPGGRLVRDYLAGAPRLAPFFAGFPTDPAAYRDQFERVGARFGESERRRAAAALRPTSPRAAERLERFVREGGAVVTTGQQAGLFTGPLYTIYKILSTVRWADALERELGTPVLPVFWVASEDHDWEEVNHANVVGRDGELHALALPGSGGPALPMSDRRLPEEVESTLAELAQVIAGEPFADGCLTLLRTAYRPGTTVAGAFRETVEALFAPLDLFTTDAADPVLKEASVPVLRASLLRAAEEEAAVSAQTRRLVEQGYHEQVNILPSATNVFLQTEAGRERLYRRGDGWTARESRRMIGAAELDARFAEAPGRFSPNVFLRPVVESAVFPVLAYVAGPGEIAYFAQLRCLFREHGLEMPLVVPRSSLLLIEPEVETLLGDVPFSIPELQAPEAELAMRIARERLPEPVRDAVGDLREAVVDRYAALIEAAAAVDPTLAGPLGTRRNAALNDIADAERKILGRVRANHSLLLRRVETVRGSLYPFGTPQERVLNVFPFLARHGPDLLPTLLARMSFQWSASPAGWPAPSGCASAPEGS